MTGRLARALAAVAIVAATTALLPSPAEAQITGGCAATINGRDANLAHDVRSAIAVDEGSSVTVNGAAPGPITTYKLYLTFAGIRIPAGDGSVGNGLTSYNSSVDVAKYAKYGVGLYRVEGETQGTACTGWAYVKVVGKMPLTTAAGMVGAAMFILGLLGMSLSWPRAPRNPPTGVVQ